MDNDEPKYKLEIQQMMYVAGETEEVAVETISLVESIIKEQVILLISTAGDLAARRGSRSFSNNDLIFQFRHDDDRVGRLRAFLAWKNLRKAIKDSEDDKAELDALDASTSFENDAGERSEESSSKKPRTPLVSLPWDVSSFYAEELPDGDYGDDEMMDQSQQAVLQKLQKDDKRTRNMSVEEYTTWSEYRHASFTWRKAKRFREWSGLGVIADHKSNDDSLDILGFLTCEMVQKLTEEALAIQAREMAHKKSHTAAPSAAASSSLFDAPPGSRPPIEVKHIRLAFEKFQIPPKRTQIFRNRNQPPERGKLRLI